MCFGDQEYRWIVDAPIEEFDGNIEADRDKFQQYALWLGYDLNAYIEGLQDAKIDKDPGVEKKRTEQSGKVAWQLQSGNISGAGSMLKTFQQRKPLSKNKFGAAYMLSGRPVALFVFFKTKDFGTQTEHGYVCDILCHPGVKGAGSIMLEWALNSLGGTNPTLMLYALTNEACRAYTEMGFTGPKAKMILDPTKSEKWCQLYGEWRYKSSSSPNASGYLSTDPDALGVLPPTGDTGTSLFK